MFRRKGRNRELRGIGIDERFGIAVDVCRRHVLLHPAIDRVGETQSMYQQSANRMSMMGDVTHPVGDTYGVSVMRRRHVRDRPWRPPSLLGRLRQDRARCRPSDVGSELERRVQVPRLCCGRGGHAMGIRIGSV